MIKSFRCEETRKVLERETLRRFPPTIHRTAHRKLLILDAAESLEDLRVPRENRLEKLKGDRKGQYSVRITDRWRVCFRWLKGDAYDVEIVDYH
jgi:proteic killer suppression protein